MRIYEIQAALLLGRGVLLHAAAATKSGSGAAFLAPSGGGKSTMAAALSGLGWQRVCDDKAVLCRNSYGHYSVYPAPGDPLWSDGPQASARLSALVLVEKARQLSIREDGCPYVRYRLFRDFQMWTDRERLFASMQNQLAARVDLDRLLEEVPLLTISYDPRSDAQLEAIDRCLAGI
jgi:hypothetical protein